MKSITGHGDKYGYVGVMKNRDVARSFPWEKTLRLKRIQRKPNLLIRINQAVMVQCHSLKCPPG